MFDSFETISPYIYSFIAISSEVICWNIVWNAVLNKRKHINNLTAFLITMVGLLVAAFTILMKVPLWAKGGIAVLVITLLSMVLYRGSTLKHIFINTYQHAMYMAFEGLLLLPTMNTPLFYSTESEYELLGTIYVLVEKILLILPSYLVANNLYTKIGNQLEVKQPIPVLLLVMLLVTAVEPVTYLDNPLLAGVMDIAVLLTLYIIFRYVYSASALSIKEHEHQLLLQQFDQQKAHSRDIEEVMKRQRMFEHDNKAQWSVQAQLLNNDEIEKATNHANTRAGEAGRLSIEHVTGNTSLDTILGVKQAEADNNGVDFSVKHNSLLSCPIPDGEISSLLSNMLNNAFEATLLCPEGNRIVQVNLELNSGELCMAVRNTHCNQVVERDGVFSSSKDESEHHGLGLRIIRSILEKYGEEPYFDYDDQWFQISITIPFSANEKYAYNRKRQ